MSDLPAVMEAEADEVWFVVSRSQEGVWYMVSRTPIGLWHCGCRWGRYGGIDATPCVHLMAVHAFLESLRKAG